MASVFNAPIVGEISLIPDGIQAGQWKLTAHREHNGKRFFVFSHVYGSKELALRAAQRQAIKITPEMLNA